MIMIFAIFVLVVAAICFRSSWMAGGYVGVSQFLIGAILFLCGVTSLLSLAFEYLVS